MSGRISEPYSRALVNNINEMGIALFAIYDEVNNGLPISGETHAGVAANCVGKIKAIREQRDAAEKLNVELLQKVQRLETQGSEHEAAACRMREALETINQLSNAQYNDEVDTLGPIGREAANVLAASSPCPHEAEVKRLREALAEIAHSPHCVYDSGGVYSSEHESGYKMGVADGHRCAASIARIALALCGIKPVTEGREG